MYIQTYTGKRFYPFQPDKHAIALEDVAQGLSNTCRFGGQIKTFYSVAQHSCIVAHIMKKRDLPKKFQLYGLLHDASEAYLCDLPTPVKFGLLAYKDLEHNVQNIILQHFGLDSMDPEVEKAVKHADLTALATEAKKFYGNVTDWKSIAEIPAGEFTIDPMVPADAKAAFLSKFRELKDAATQ